MRDVLSRYCISNFTLLRFFDHLRINYIFLTNKNIDRKYYLFGWNINLIGTTWFTMISRFSSKYYEFFLFAKVSAILKYKNSRSVVNKSRRTGQGKIPRNVSKNETFFDEGVFV